MGALADSHGADDLPVANVPWDEANRFCQRIGQREGRVYRLPTEAEWEYACRAGTTTPFAGTGRPKEMAWYNDNAGDHLHPVARNLPNRWGLYDMHGNVAEWCLDRYDAYSMNSTIDPRGPEAGKNRVIRGGSIAQAPEACRSAARGARREAERRMDTGFRVVLEVENKVSGAPK
jgi:formylglycine-generating enzyme required for sulfatase activity